jgi:hypothetical protein
MKLQVENLLPYHFVRHIIHTDRHRQINNFNKIFNKQISTRYLCNTYFNIIQICHFLSSKYPFPPKKITSVLLYIFLNSLIWAEKLNYVTPHLKMHIVLSVKFYTIMPQYSESLFPVS